MRRSRSFEFNSAQATKLVSDDRFLGYDRIWVLTGQEAARSCYWLLCWPLRSAPHVRIALDGFESTYRSFPENIARKSLGAIKTKAERESVSVEADFRWLFFQIRLHKALYGQTRPCYSQALDAMMKDMSVLISQRSLSCCDWPGNSRTLFDLGPKSWDHIPSHVLAQWEVFSKSGYFQHHTCKKSLHSSAMTLNRSCWGMKSKIWFHESNRLNFLI